MRHTIVSLKINAQTMADARERARQVGEIFNLDTLQRTRFATAVSEIARNTVQYAGDGTLSFLFDTESQMRRQQCVVAQFTDSGPGIPDLPGVAALYALPGTPQPGIAAARRLVDRVDIECPAQGGTVVTLLMCLPRGHKPLSMHDIQARIDVLARRRVLTPLEELEQQNRDMLLALEELRRRQLSLEQADVRKNEFMTMLAHELRNPLATLSMSLTVLQRKTVVTPEDLAQRCEVMARQTAQMVRMVDDLTDVTRVEKGKVELREMPVEVNGLVKDALEMTASAILERKHDVAFRAAPQELWLQGDSSRLLQVFANVIQNAAKYTPEQGRIEIAVHSQGSEAVIEVSDNGVGIDAEMLPNVFGLFVQAKARSADDHSGLGVGLTLADRLVRDHGGSISVKSDGVGHGSQFTIKLPLLAAAHP
ncbi:MAG: sensor histidine kinase [Ramlibacter sp.]